MIKMKSVKVYPEDLTKLLIRKINSDAKSIADIIHELLEEPKEG